MIITLDVGNSQIFGGLFVAGQLQLRFRKTTNASLSSDELGLFLCQVLRENGHPPEQVKQIVIGSVVPEINYSISSACIKYFDIRPLLLHHDLKLGIKLQVPSPGEVGADRIANAVAATAISRDRNLAIVDFGTAITCCVINSKREFLGGTIAPGLKLSVRALEQHTARLPSVAIQKPTTVLNTTTEHNIQAGIYYSALGMVKEILARLEREQGMSDLVVIGTGGFASLFLDEKLFDHHDPDLVLKGLYRVYQLNASGQELG